MRQNNQMLFAGLFCITFSTLLLEILDGRLLSVLTWYHLSFLALSLAMLGMAAGAIRVYVGGPQFAGQAALRRLPGAALAFAAAMAASHVVSLCIPLTVHSIASPIGFASFTTIIAALTVPFYYSGITVTIALTRAPASIGRLYACDLAGAAFGCLAVVPLLDSGWFNLSSLVLLGAAVAAVGAHCFSVAFAPERRKIALPAAALLAAAAFANGARMHGLEIAYPKNRQYWMAEHIDRTYWNSHSYVVVQRPGRWEPFLWGAGAKQVHSRVESAWMVIDGEAGTPITKWDGDPASLDWVRHDVTSLPYYLRRGSVAIIGFGGGRDILAAIWGRNPRITGIDVNQTMLRLLTESHRTFANIAARPEVRLVHDDGRAFLTRSSDRYDVIQMSLIDTWAATGAGAYSLTENGLYTVEAWRVVLSRLAETGVFSVSRWFAPGQLSETSRLLSLATAALIDFGVAHPIDHLLMVSRGSIATVMISPSPYTSADRDTLERVAADEAFAIEVAPWKGGSIDRLDRIARSRTAAALIEATADPRLDFTPPTDNRPFFFNILKARTFAWHEALPPGVVSGNLHATTTLVVLFFIAAAMVGATIGAPLAATGLPPMAWRPFAASVLYFAAIGFGFMLVQVALLQRFAIYLGHPTHTLSITLFSMILFAGVGSYASDRFSPLSERTERALPLVAGGLLLAMAIAIPAVTTRTIGFGLPARSAIVVGLLAPVSIVLGFFFPIGMRSVAAVSPLATAWMWGINGACSVLGSIAAVAISIFVGIHANLIAAVLLYGGLFWPLAVLQRLDRVAAREIPPGARASGAPTVITGG
jgi:hypothetical protein